MPLAHAVSSRLVYTWKRCYIDRLGGEHGLVLGNNRLLGRDGVLGGNLRGEGVLRGDGVISRGGLRLLERGKRLGLLDGRKGLIDGSSGELGLLLSHGEGGGGVLNSGLLRADLRRLGSATEELLNLASVVASVLLSKSGNVVNLLLRNIADLSSLSVDHIGSGLELSVDELLVGGVHERGEEDDSSSDDSKAPVGNNLDQVVADEGGSESLGFR